MAALAGEELADRYLMTGAAICDRAQSMAKVEGRRLALLGDAPQRAAGLDAGRGGRDDAEHSRWAEHEQDDIELAPDDNNFGVG